MHAYLLTLPCGQLDICIVASQVQCEVVHYAYLLTILTLLSILTIWESIMHTYHTIPYHTILTYHMGMCPPSL